jgi:hypothetical protein
VLTERGTVATRGTVPSDIEKAVGIARKSDLEALATSKEDASEQIAGCKERGPRYL